MVVYFLGPKGKTSDLLFETFKQTFVGEGHVIAHEITASNVVFFDLYSGLGEYNQDELDFVISNRLPVVVFDATDYGAMSNERFFLHRFSQPDYHKVSQWEAFLVDAIELCKVIYFMRKLDKTLQFPNWVYPYEVVLYPDHIFEVVTKEELRSRPNSLCFIGNTSPTRERVCHGLRDIGKTDFVLGQPRIPHNEWLNRHRQAKMFIEACGGGFGSERPFQLITIAPMLRVRRHQFAFNDFVDGEDCIEVDENPTLADWQRVGRILGCPDELYSIYEKGVLKMRTYYTIEYRALYILSVLKQNKVC